ncbi:HD domain-containing protein [Pseudobutyrivibrio sp. LB2011]|uniref:HD domain-containing protein n=1 Tax=Pseudobutyrivibrio sp. LB2011 TaxID=1408312 RepID=UPI0006786AB7|nr:HD domain-containing protein [Pseudobutyrivibrio sp. LB2011]
MELMKINEIKKGEVAKEIPLIVIGYNQKFKKSDGAPFVIIEFFDGIQKINVSFWDEYVESIEAKGIVVGSILKVLLTIDGKYYNQHGYRLNDDPSITADCFRKIAPIRDFEKAYNFILNSVRAVDSNPTNEGDITSIAKLTLKLLEDNKGAFIYSSAAVKMHHNFIGGLLFHTVRMVSLAVNACETYNSLDKELLICGTALHDIGKITCYLTSEIGDTQMSVTGRLLDHAIIGIKMIDEEARKGNYDPSRIELLQHLLASHHGKLEWGAVVTPAIPEAEMLHLVDMIDSRMNMFEEAYKGQEEGTVSNTTVWGLEGSYIYKPFGCLV